MLKKILICSNFYPPFFIGGAELIAHEQACCLKQAGYELAVFCGKLDESRRRYSIIRENFDGLKVFRVVLHRQDYEISHNFYNDAVDNQFDAVIQEIKPDVVHFHNIISLSLGIIERARRSGIKSVLTLHDHWGFCYKNTRLKTYEQVCNDFSKCDECLPELMDVRGRRLHIRMRNDYIAFQLNKVDYLVSPSSYLASAYTKAGIRSEKISIISYGIDAQRFSKIKKIPDEKGVMRFSFIGHLGFHKGVHVLISAINILLQLGYLGTLCKVNVVGTGAMGDDLVRFIKENQIGSAVKLWGKVEHSQIETVYENTDVLLTPSVWPENEPVTILEAMAAGIPVLASALGGNLDLVKDGFTGYLFESGNAHMLAEKMVQMAQNPEQIKSMGQKAYQKLTDNTLQNYVRRITKIYQNQEPISENASYRVILCSGEYLSPECFYVIANFKHDNYGERYKFVMSEWITAEEWEAVDIVWIIDDKGKKQDISRALTLGKAVLVPNQNQELVELCRSRHCGLFYDDEIEAEVCLEYLISNPSILTALSLNARS